MLAIPGYFDGTAIRPLEKMTAKPNQRVIITVLDEFVEPETATERESLRGILSSLADPSLRAQEDGAWERMAVEKHGSV